MLMMQIWGSLWLINKQEARRRLGVETAQNCSQRFPRNVPALQERSGARVLSQTRARTAHGLYLI
jgi:hypothetical protein